MPASGEGRDGSFTSPLADALPPLAGVCRPASPGAAACSLSPDGAGAGADFLPKPNMSGHSWDQGAGQIPFLSSIAMIIDTALETTAVEIWFRACWL